MQEMILAINILDYESIDSSVFDICCDGVKGQVADLVIFLPELGDSMVDVLKGLSKLIKTMKYSGRINFFVSEADREIASFDSLSKLKNEFPRVNVCSKDNFKIIGDVVFQSFSTKNLYSGQLDELVLQLYDKSSNYDCEYCFAIDSSDDRNVIGHISNRFVCLEPGVVKAFYSNKIKSNISTGFFVEDKDFVEQQSKYSTQDQKEKPIIYSKKKGK